MEYQNIRSDLVNLGTGIIMVRRYAFHLRIGRHGHLCELGLFRIFLFDDFAQTALEQGHAG